MKTNSTQNFAIGSTLLLVRDGSVMLFIFGQRRQCTQTLHSLFVSESFSMASNTRQVIPFDPCLVQTNTRTTANWRHPASPHHMIFLRCLHFFTCPPPFKPWGRGRKTCPPWSSLRDGRSGRKGVGAALTPGLAVGEAPPNVVSSNSVKTPSWATTTPAIDTS